MLHKQNETKRNIERLQDSLTAVERSIATFFIQNTKHMDFSSRNVSKQLYVSEATLSRFAKKLGYRGYREFIYSYEKDLDQELSDSAVTKPGDMVQLVRQCYQKVMQESFTTLDEAQLQTVTELMEHASCVLVYGVGYSGLAASVFALRFSQLGLRVQAVTDPKIMQVQSSISGKDVLVLGFSISGKTPTIQRCMKLAVQNGAQAVMLTSDRACIPGECFQSVLHLADVRNMDDMLYVSPEIPLLVMTDILHAYYLSGNTQKKLEHYYTSMQPDSTPAE